MGAVAVCSDCGELELCWGLEEAQQQAAAAGGHYASEAQATPRVDVGDPPEASSFHLFEVLSCVMS